MAIDVRGIIDYDLAAHLFDNASNKGVFKYYIDEKPKFQYEGHVKPIKMTKQDVAYIDSVMLGIGQMTGLKPTRDKKGKKSTFDIQKFDFGNGGDTVLGYMYPESWGVYLAFSDAYQTAEINNLTRETIDHEIAHGIGLGHPYGDGFNENYSTVDTVMSYNDVYYENGEEVYFGFTPSDDAAISYWWGNANYKIAGNPTSIDGGLYVAPNESKADGHDNDDEASTHGIEVFEIAGKKLKLDFNNLSRHAENNESSGGPFILNLNESNNKINSTKWSPEVAERLTEYGKITIHANAGDDAFIMSGLNLSTQQGFKFSLSGGEGKDKLVVKNIDSITGSAGLLFGYNDANSNIPRAIRLYGAQGDLVDVSFGDAAKSLDASSSVVIWDDIETIKLQGVKYTFDELYDLLPKGGFEDSVSLAELI